MPEVESKIHKIHVVDDTWDWTLSPSLGAWSHLLKRLSMEAGGLHPNHHN